jgi:hypothetical protein
VVWLAVTRPDILRRMVVVGLVAVDVHLKSVLVGQGHGEPDRLHPVLPGELIVRDAADHVRAQPDGPAHEFLAALEAEDALLRERDKLEVDQAAYLLAQVGQSPQRRQFRIADVDVAADVLYAAGQLPAQDLAYPRLHVLVGEVLHPLSPDRDALEQRPGDIGPGLPDGEDGIQVDVGLDQRGSDQPPAQVNGLRRRRAIRPGHDHAIGDRNVRKRVLACQPRVTQEQIDHAPIMARVTGARTAPTCIGRRVIG